MNESGQWIHATNQTTKIALLLSVYDGSTSKPLLLLNTCWQVLLASFNSHLHAQVLHEGIVSQDEIQSCKILLNMKKNNNNNNNKIKTYLEEITHVR